MRRGPVKRGKAVVDERRQGVDVQTGLIEDAEPISNPKVDRRFSKQLNDECPHGCVDDWIHGADANAMVQICPIHGTGRKGGKDE